MNTPHEESTPEVQQKPTTLLEDLKAWWRTTIWYEFLKTPDNQPKMKDWL